MSHSTTLSLVVQRPFDGVHLERLLYGENQPESQANIYGVLLSIANGLHQLVEALYAIQDKGIGLMQDRGIGLEEVVQAIEDHAMMTRPQR